MILRETRESKIMFTNICLFTKSTYQKSGSSKLDR